LIKQERFEIEVLEKLNSRKFLNNLTFGGGTMLRLCFGLNRYSVDLDFWLTKKIDKKKLYREIKAYLAGQYVLKDSADKFYTVLFELKSKDYPRSLKIEIRKEIKKVKTEQAIAYSRYSNGQVFLKIVSLESMMESKIKAFLDRKEIRDVFDMEFLIKKGIILSAEKGTLRKLLKEMEILPKRDYTGKLAGVLEPAERKYYTSENFKILKSALREKLQG